MFCAFSLLRPGIKNTANVYNWNRFAYNYCMAHAVKPARHDMIATSLSSESLVMITC